MKTSSKACLALAAALVAGGAAGAGAQDKAGRSFPTW